MDIKQLESAIDKKAQERAETRARAFIEAINNTWKKFFGRHLEFHSSARPTPEEIETVTKILVAISKTEGSRYFQAGQFLADVVVEAERKKVVDEILQATEAVRELADLRGEES